MSRSSSPEHAQRINAALELLKEDNSMARAAAALTERFSVSRSQAYRYVRKAQSMHKQVPIPEPKIPFTVKLSMELTRKVRRYAGSTGRSLSDIVAQALEAYLRGNHGRG